MADYSKDRIDELEDLV